MKIQKTGYQQNFGESIFLKAAPRNRVLLNGLLKVDEQLWKNATKTECRAILHDLGSNNGYTTWLLFDGKEADEYHALCSRYLEGEREGVAKVKFSEIWGLGNRIADKTQSTTFVQSVNDIMNLPMIQKCCEASRLAIEAILRAQH